MAEAQELGTAVAAIFGAVVGVLSSVLAFSPRVRALERDATASEILRKEQREGDARRFAEQRESDTRVINMEMQRIRDDAAREYRQLTEKMDAHHRQQREDCRSGERREKEIMHMLAQVAGKLNITNRASDVLAHIIHRSDEEDSNG